MSRIKYFFAKLCPLIFVDWLTDKLFLSFPIKNGSTLYCTHSKVRNKITSHIFHKIQPSFVDLRWAHLYVSLVLWFTNWDVRRFTNWSVVLTIYAAINKMTPKSPEDFWRKKTGLFLLIFKWRYSLIHVYWREAKGSNFPPDTQFTVTSIATDEKIQHTLFVNMTLSSAQYWGTSSDL